DPNAESRKNGGIYDRTEESRIYPIRDNMDSLRLHTIEAHHVFLAVLAYCRNSGCPARTERIDRFRFISSPPAEGLAIRFVGSVMDQKRWTSCKKRNHVTRTQQQILRSVRME